MFWKWSKSKYPQVDHYTDGPYLAVDGSHFIYSNFPSESSDQHYISSSINVYIPASFLYNSVSLWEEDIACSRMQRPRTTKQYSPPCQTPVPHPSCPNHPQPKGLINKHTKQIKSYQIEFKIYIYKCMRKSESIFFFISLRCASSSVYILGC